MDVAIEVLKNYGIAGAVIILSFRLIWYLIRRIEKITDQYNDSIRSITQEFKEAMQDARHHYNEQKEHTRDIKDIVISIKDKLK